MAINLLAIPWATHPFFSLGRWDGTSLTLVANYILPTATTGMASSVHPDETCVAAGLVRGPFDAPVLYVLNWDGTNLTLGDSYKPGAALCKSCEFSRDGQYLAATFNTSNVAVLKWDGTNLSLVATYPLLQCEECSWSPDGRYLAVTKVDPNALDPIYLKILEFDGSSLTLVASASNTVAPYFPFFPHSCSFSPDGKYLIVGNAFTPYVELFRWVPHSLTRLDTFNAGSRVFDCDWNINGQDIALAHEAAPFLTMIKREDDTLIGVTSHNLGSLAYGCPFTPDGKYLAAGFVAANFIKMFDWDGVNLTVLQDGAVGITNIVRRLSFFKTMPPVLKAYPPHDLLCEQKKNPTDVTDPAPEFSAVHKYEEEV